MENNIMRVASKGIVLFILVLFCISCSCHNFRNNEALIDISEVAEHIWSDNITSFREIDEKYGLFATIACAVSFENFTGISSSSLIVDHYGGYSSSEDRERDIVLWTKWFNENKGSIYINNNYNLMYFDKKNNTQRVMDQSVLVQDVRHFFHRRESEKDETK